MPQQAKDINDNVGMEAHIYENLPGLTSTPKGHLNAELRKYFPREAIYENLCRGCGYGVFAAQGRYCHFCQCIVSGGVVSTPPPPPPPPLSTISGESSNIYENICDLCRGIYSDNERCRCQRSETPAKAPAPSTPTTPPTPPTKVKSRSLLGYSKSSAATLTRLFGSLKQLKRSSSLQRRIFPRTPTTGSSSAGSLEIIHNVDEVFRTQETFDLQRICELKLEQQQLKGSQSDQHIYGRVREPEESQSHKRERKRPRVSRIRLLQDESTSGSSSLYLNESICQWMTSLRRQVHHYDEGPWQQPKSVPARDPSSSAEESTVTLRRSTEESAKCADEQAKLVKDFKRKLQQKRAHNVEPEREQRRCAITANFVNDYLSALGEEKEAVQHQQVAAIEEHVAVVAIAIQPQVSVSLLRLMQSLALSASLHVSVRGFLTAYDKSFSLWLWHQQQQQRQQPPINGYRRRRARDSVVGVVGDWRRRLPLFAFSFAGGNDRSVASASVSVSPAISESVDVCAAAASRRRANRSTRRRGTAIVREEGVCGGESSTSSNNSKKNNNNNSNNNSGALMAAPKPNGEAERPSTNSNNNTINCSSNNNNDNISNNNNNHHTVDNESGINNNKNNDGNANCNVNEQQQQQQQQPITQVNTH